MKKPLMILCCALGLLSSGLPTAAQRTTNTYPLMRPDWETRQRWILSSLAAPVAPIDPSLAYSRRGSLSLLSHIQYTPSERNQLDCGNCWSWAGTGVMEVSLDVLAGIKDRLSVQFLCTCGGKPSCGCMGGWLEEVATFYQGTPYAVPWANPGAAFLNGDGTCNNTCGSIGISPNYPITSITLQTIDTQTTNDSAAISNIKNILNQGKAIWFAFFLPRGSDWTTFFTFWDNQPESSIFDPDFVCGTTWDEGGGGHAILCVGYNDDDPDPNQHYWVMLNSWGTAGGNRTNGLLRWKMNTDYGCVAYDRGLAESCFYWQTLAITWGTSSTPDAGTSNAVSVTTSSATLRGTVNPNGRATTYWFEYGLDTSYGSSTTKRSAGSGTSNSNVTEAISGLLSASTYHFRLAASNSAGTSVGGDLSFSTASSGSEPPTVGTEPADSLTATSAVLHATVNPRGSATTWSFEYGPTTGYGSTTAPQSAGSTTAPVSVSAPIGNLAVSNLYHFRIKASNSAGTAYGTDRTFSTRASSSILLSEGFEHDGGAPPGWTQQYVYANYYADEYIDWIYCYGDNYWFVSPPAPHSGNYNAFFYDEDYYAWTALITPPVDFGSGGEQTTLTFWHYMAVDAWWGDQDELHIYLGETVDGPWTLIASFTDDVWQWTKQTVTLPNPTGTCYISFDAISYWGYGVAVDDVEVTMRTSSDPGADINQVMALNGNQMVFRWDASASDLYRVDVCDNLAGTNGWREDTAAGTLAPYGNEVWYTNTITGAPPCRCYRVRRLAP